MNELKIINEQIVLGKEFKIYGTIENPLFLAKDVANWIEYSVANVNKMLDKVDEEEKTTHTISMNGNYTTQAWFLTEDGLYEVLMQSRKPIAKAFKKEVKKILKQIRLTGGAVVKGKEEEFINKYFPSFSEETKLQMVQDLMKQNEQYKEKINLLGIQSPYTINKVASKYEKATWNDVKNKLIELKWMHYNPQGKIIIDKPQYLVYGNKGKKGRPSIHFTLEGLKEWQRLFPTKIN